MGSECGQIQIIELITWKVYKDLLNFEIEADEQLDTLINLVSKRRF